MKIRIDVATRREGDAIRAGLTDPQVRAFVTVMGTLLRLPSDRSRVRLLRWITDKTDEVNEQTDIR